MTHRTSENAPVRDPQPTATSEALKSPEEVRREAREKASRDSTVGFGIWGGEGAEDPEFRTVRIDALLQESQESLRRDQKTEAEVLARIAIWFSREISFFSDDATVMGHPLVSKHHLLARALCSPAPGKLVDTIGEQQTHGDFLPKSYRGERVCWAGSPVFSQLAIMQDWVAAVGFLLEQSRGAMLAGQPDDAERLVRVALGMDSLAVMGHPIVRDLHLLAQVLPDPDQFQLYPRLPHLDQVCVKSRSWDWLFAPGFFR